MATELKKGGEVAKTKGGQTAPAPAKNKDPFLVWNISEDIKQAFKAACARKGISMRDAVIEMLKEYASNA